MKWRCDLFEQWGTFLYPNPKMLVGGLLVSPCLSIRLSICKWHGTTSVWFGLSILNFICILPRPLSGRFSWLKVKLCIFWNFYAQILILGRVIQIDHWSTVSNLFCSPVTPCSVQNCIKFAVEKFQVLLGQPPSIVRADTMANGREYQGSFCLCAQPMRDVTL